MNRIYKIYYNESTVKEVLLVNIFLAEWTSKEENHGTSAAISQC
jgi:hypothetical protein